MLEYERDAVLKSERLANQVERHLSTLQSIRAKIEERSLTKERSAEYRQWKKEFASKKSDILWSVQFSVLQCSVVQCAVL